MIYLDESIVDDPRVIKAGHLFGERSGGRAAALGVFVMVIGYARRHLTDGDVPHAYLASVPGGERMVKALADAGLLRKKSQGVYTIPAFLKWNKSAEQLKRERAQTRQRLRAFRARQRESDDNGGGDDVDPDTPVKRTSNAVSNAGVTRRTKYDPRSTYHAPPGGTSQGYVIPSDRSTSKDRAVGKEKQPAPRRKQRYENSTFPQLAAIASEVLRRPAAIEDEGDFVERVKALAAKRQRAYGDPARLRSVCDAALAAHRQAHPDYRFTADAPDAPAGMPPRLERSDPTRHVVSDGRSLAEFVETLKAPDLPTMQTRLRRLGGHRA